MDETTEEWITASDAAKILTNNRGKTVRPDYVTKLGNNGKIRTKKMGKRFTLYSSADVQNYRVENRGEAIARIQKQRAAERKKERDGSI